jgi:hypothetical protein
VARGENTGKNGAQKYYFCNDLKLYKPFVIARMAFANFLQVGAKINELKCFIVCLENEIATPQQ